MASGISSPPTAQESSVYTAYAAFVAEQPDSVFRGFTQNVSVEGEPVEPLTARMICSIRRALLDPNRFPLPTSAADFRRAFRDALFDLIMKPIFARHPAVLREA